MHLTISFDGLVFYVVRNIGTRGAMLTKPFATVEGALAEVTELLNLAEKTRGIEKRGPYNTPLEEEGLS